jgi:hypothetical protein
MSIFLALADEIAKVCADLMVKEEYSGYIT